MAGSHTSGGTRQSGARHGVAFSGRGVGVRSDGLGPGPGLTPPPAVGMPVPIAGPEYGADLRQPRRG
jgi:hypothetical protein